MKIENPLWWETRPPRFEALQWDGEEESSESLRDLIRRRKTSAGEVVSHYFADAGERRTMDGYIRMPQRLRLSVVHDYTPGLATTLYRLVLYPGDWLVAREGGGGVEVFTDEEFRKRYRPVRG